jgi:hypothetical protein
MIVLWERGVGAKVVVAARWWTIIRTWLLKEVGELVTKKT